MDTPILSKDKTTCTIGDVTLKIEESIDYKSATEIRTSVGKIKAFIYPGFKQNDTTTVWMRIEDMVNTAVSEWISVRVWHEQYSRGLFRNSKKPKTNVDKKSKNVSDTPF